MSSVERVCRLCLGVIKVGKVAFDIEEENGLIKNVNNIREMLLFCAPEIDVYASFQPVICETCLPTLVTAYNFKVKCMNTENTIRSYIQKNNIRDGHVVNLRSVVVQIGRLYKTGDPTAGLIRSAVPNKKETGINEKVLSKLRTPKLPNRSVVSSSSSAGDSIEKKVSSVKITPSPSIKKPSSQSLLPVKSATARKRTKPSLPRLAKDKDQDIVVVDNAVSAKDSVARSNAAPGTLRQDRRMAYLGLRRKSPDRSKTPEESSNNSDESSDKVIVLDDDPPSSEEAEKTPPKIIISMNKDKSYSVNYDAFKKKTASPSICKPGESLISRINEVTITRKLPDSEVLMMNYDEEICSIESSDNEDVEFIEPNHPMIDLVNENPDKSLEKTDKNDAETKTDDEFTNSSKRRSSEDLPEQKSAKKIKILEESPKEDPKSTTVVEEPKTPEDPLEGLKKQILEQNPEYSMYFEKHLSIKLLKIPKKQLKPLRFVTKVQKTKLYGCKYCSYGSLDAVQAKNHFTYKHTLKGYYFCRYCEFKSKNLSDLGEHANTKHMAEMVKYLQENTKDALYRCTLCKYKGGNMLDLRHHRQSKHFKPLSNGTVACPYNCPNFWTTKMKAMHKHIESRHELEHTHQNSIFHCHVCKYEIGSKIQLGRHLNSHKKSESFRCLMCPFSTKSQKVLERHSKKHSSEELENSCGMVFIESHKKKTRYNDDYRITLDSLRRSAQDSYESIPTSSSGLFDGPSLSEMLVMSLSENIEYVDLTDAPAKTLESSEMETIFLDENSSDKTSKTDDLKDLVGLVSEMSKNFNKDESFNDEDCISTTTDENVGESSKKSKEKAEETEIIADTTDNTSQELDKNSQIHSVNDEDETDKKLNTNFSASSKESYVSCETSDLTKNVTELEHSIRELNSVLDKNVSKSLQADSFSSSDDKSGKNIDIIKEIDNFCQEVTSSTEVVEDIKRTPEESDEKPAKESTEVSDEMNTDNIEKNTEMDEKANISDGIQEDNKSKEDSTDVPEESNEDNTEKNTELEGKTIISEENSSKDTNNASQTTEATESNSPEANVEKSTPKFVSDQDKRSALEKRCLLSSMVETFNSDLNSSQKQLMVKKLSALEERIFVRNTSGSHCVEKE